VKDIIFDNLNIELIVLLFANGSAKIII
jgi:hypothetical protein